MAAPFGNQNAAKGRDFENALRRAVAQDNGKRLRAAAEKLLTLASEGESWALSMLADRLDGKPSQHVTVERKNLREMSLDELQAAVAEALGGNPGATGGANQPGAVH